MATDKKLARKAIKRSASDSPILEEQNNEQALQYIGDLADDHAFLAPFDICYHSIGLLFCLTTKRLIGISFSNIYHRSQKRDWLDLLTRERRNLKPNVNSIEKCFILNRLIAAYTKNPIEFIHQTNQLYEEIKMRMKYTATSFSTKEHLYDEIQAYRNLQCQRRLFYINDDETKHPQNLLSLQQATSNLCSQLINSCETNMKEWIHLKTALQHSFMIVVQPSTPECAAATKYEKLGNTYTAKLNSRIICLLDTDKIDAHFILSNIAVTLYSLDRQRDSEGEIQSVLEWKKRYIIDAHGLPRSFYYAELQSIKLMKTDLRSSRPFYSTKLCQLQFQLNIRMKTFNIEEDFIFLSRPFGLCSHAQYFPEYVAKVLIYEIEQIPQITVHPIRPDIIMDFICRYYTRITGIKPKSHTKEFILQQLRIIYEAKKKHRNLTSVDIYEEILSKLINQIECFVDHPYLSMMYNDNLFLGICNSKIDNEMNGTPEQHHILLRFNALSEHQSSQQASVRYIVHDGRLIKATFHTKAFVDEMCRMICESNSEKAKIVRIFPDISNRSFHDFSLYFDNELFRLSTISPPTKETYNPLIPVLWLTMRSTNDNSSSSDTESTVLNISSVNQTETNQSTIKSSMMLNERVTIQTDKFIHYLVEKLPEIFVKLQISSSHSNEILFTEQKHLIVSDILRDYLQRLSQIQASTTKIIDQQNNTKSYSFFCSTSIDT